jgi:predicted alpha-1,6-mannanase (GH76 family)
MSRKTWAMGLLAIVVGTGAMTPAHAGEAIARMPRDVADFVERAEECTFWIDAELFDGDEADAEKMKELECGRLDSDEARLRHKYQNNEQILDLLDSVGDLGC